MSNAARAISDALSIVRPPFGRVMLGTAAIGLALAALSTAAAAQDMPGLEEVVVTAQKRTENLQTTPVAVTALSGDMMESHGLSNLSDIARMTPSLTFEKIGIRSPFVFLRGVGTGAFDIGSDPSVSIFIDDLYIPRFTGLQFDLADIERVEVLKGPQGALFGRNTEGGAISVITRRPTDTLSARAVLEAGNKDYLSFRGSVSGPIAGDRLLARASVAGKRRDGWVENTLTGVDHLDEKSYGGRLQLEYRGEDLTALFTASYSRDKPNAATFMNVTPAVFLLSPASPFFGQVPSTFDPEHQAFDTDGFQRRKGVILSAKLDWDMEWATLTSVSGYLSHKFSELHDLDGTEAFVLNRYADEESDTFSQELRLTSAKDGALDWIIGAFYFKDDASRLDRWFLGPESSLSRIFAGGNMVTINDDVDVDTESWALFGQIGYDITEEFRVTIGGRYSEDKKESSRTTSRTHPTPLLFVPYTVSPEAKWNSFDPQVSLQYSPTEDVMIYVSYSEGFKSGGFQPAVAANPSIGNSVFDPETVQSYEAGLKSMFFDNRVRLNLAAFHVKYKDLQFLSANGVLPNGAPLVVTTNAADSHTDGFEVEIQAAVTENFMIAAGYSYLHAVFDEYVDGSGVSQEGNQIIRTPKHQGHATATYTVPLRSGRINLTGDISARSRVYFDPNNVKAVSQEGFALLGARVEYESEGGDWKVALWGRNLGNKDYCSNSIIFANSTVGACTIGELRSYGLSLSYALT